MKKALIALIFCLSMAKAQIKDSGARCNFDEYKEITSKVYVHTWQTDTIIHKWNYHAKRENEDDLTLTWYFWEDGKLLYVEKYINKQPFRNP